MPAARSFTELLFWQRARQWSKTIFNHSQTKPFVHDERLRVQINDSSESVMSNMAEGFGRGAQEEFIRFLGYALGSLDENLLASVCLLRPEVSDEGSVRRTVSRRR